MNYSFKFKIFNWIVLISIYLIVIAGSFVRITGSGMGCPDWPKCFGQWVPPTQKSQLPSDYKNIYISKREKKIKKFCSFLNSIGLKETSQKISQDPTLLIEDDFNGQKTWTEYVNRLIGFLSGNLMIILFIWMFIKYRIKKTLLLQGLNIVLMGIQGWFGSIVVASNLVPWTITVHLFMALLIIGIQNSANKSKVNILINETVYLPVSFIIGVSFISGSIIGNILCINKLFDKK